MLDTVGVWRGRQRWTLTGSTLPGPGGAGAPAAASRSVQISAEWCLNISVDNITAARARVLGAGSVRRGRGAHGARLPQRQVPGPGLQHSQVATYSGDSQDSYTGHNTQAAPEAGPQDQAADAAPPPVLLPVVALVTLHPALPDHQDQGV